MFRKDVGSPRNESERCQRGEVGLVLLQRNFVRILRVWKQAFLQLCEVGLMPPGLDHVAWPEALASNSILTEPMPRHVLRVTNQAVASLRWCKPRRQVKRMKLRGHSTAQSLKYEEEKAN